jgi:hypothetical protein
MPDVALCLPRGDACLEHRMNTEPQANRYFAAMA